MAALFLFFLLLSLCTPAVAPRGRPFGATTADRWWATTEVVSQVLAMLGRGLTLVACTRREVDKVSHFSFSCAKLHGPNSSI